MVKKDQTDYAAAYRQYCAYGRGRSLKQFCEDEDFNTLSPIRYISHLLKTLPTLGTSAERRNLLPCYCQL